MTVKPPVFQTTTEYKHHIGEALAELDLDPRLTYEPKRIISILSPSRGGSTVFKHALAMHPEITNLAGEEEPYYKLAQNGYPWSKSDNFYDSFEDLNCPELIRTLIANELKAPIETVRNNRKILQQRFVEELPFVDQDDRSERVTDTLLVKTPQNCYRPGLLEELYPKAEIMYLSMTRDPRATINGLLDGWASDSFQARWTPGGWWKFDMPPNWSWDVTVLEACINQWRSARVAIAKGFTVAGVISFEEFLDDWIGTCRQVWYMLGLSSWSPGSAKLPILSATDKPERARWRKKRPWLDEIGLKE